MLAEDELQLIRIEIADRSEQKQFSDDEIQAVHSAKGEVIGRTVIALIESQIAEIGQQPDFDDGALRVEHRNRLASLRLRLATARAEYMEYPVTVVEADV